MRVKYSQIHDMLVSTVDLATADTDSLNRLTNLVQLEREVRTLVKQARNKAAYDAKKDYAVHVIKQLTGLSTHTIDYWMRAHRYKTGAPALYGRPKKPLEPALDLSDQHRQEEPSHPTSELEPSQDQ